MNDTKIASKAKAQLAHFMGKVFTHFSKPSRKFIEECIYGIQASGDTKLSSIVRAIDDDTRPIYTEKRLSRNLDDETLEASVAEWKARPMPTHSCATFFPATLPTLPTESGFG